MKEAEVLDCLAFSHIIQHEMSRAFDWTVSLPDVLASGNEVKIAQTRRKSISLVVGDAVERAS
jgi:hypothetical protein